MSVVLVMEPLEVSAKLYMIDYSYHPVDSIPLHAHLYDCSYILPCLFGTKSYRDTPPTTHLSLNRYTSNDIWLCLQSLLTTSLILHHRLPTFHAWQTQAPLLSFMLSTAKTQHMPPTTFRLELVCSYPKVPKKDKHCRYL
jgi:hypothetical protein